MAVLRKNAGYNVLLSLTQFAFPLITFPYASRILGPKALGAVSLADNFTVYFLIFSGLGIPLYGLREVAKVKHNRQLLGQTFSSLLFIHLVTAIVAVTIFFILTISDMKEFLRPQFEYLCFLYPPQNFLRLLFQVALKAPMLD